MGPGRTGAEKKRDKGRRRSTVAELRHGGGDESRRQAPLVRKEANTRSTHRSLAPRSHHEHPLALAGALSWWRPAHGFRQHRSSCGSGRRPGSRICTWRLAKPSRSKWRLRGLHRRAHAAIHIGYASAATLIQTELGSLSPYPQISPAVHFSRVCMICCVLFGCTAPQPARDGDTGLPADSVAQSTGNVIPHYQIAYEPSAVVTGDSLRLTMDLEIEGVGNAMVRARLRLTNTGSRPYHAGLPDGRHGCGVQISGDIATETAPGEGPFILVERMLTLEPGESVECSVSRAIRPTRPVASILVTGTLRTYPERSIAIGAVVTASTTR